MNELIHRELLKLQDRVKLFNFVFITECSKMEYNIYMRLNGEVTLVEANLAKDEALDHAKTLNLLNDEGEVYYILPIEVMNTQPHK